MSKNPLAGIACVLTSLLAFWATSCFAGQYKPAIEYSSLLNMRFYEDSGSFMADKLQLVFPPEQDKSYSLAVVDESSTVVASLKLKLERWDDFPAFAGLQPVGSGVITLGKPGAYTLAFLMDKEIITSKPFTLKVTQSADPFNPKTTFYREGFWPNVGYLAVPSDKPEAPLMFTWWTSLREAPQTTDQARCMLYLLQNGKPVAMAPSAVIISSNSWNSFTSRLVQPKESGGKNMTLAMLTALSGDLKLGLKIDDKPVKTYTVKVASGEIVPLPFNKPDYEPHSSYISPRKIDTSSRSGSNYKMQNAYWVVRD